VGLQPIEVEGTLHADGTLVLDEKPNVPPGRVRVTLSPVAGATPPEDGFMARMEAVWAAQKARGYISPSRDEIDAELAAMRDEAEEEMREVERLSEDCRRPHETSGTDSESPS
jgi:hypothetical protein